MSFGAQVFHQRRGADDAHWQRGAALLVDLAEPGDALRVHPSWTEAPMPYLLAVGNLLHRQHHPLLEDFTGLDRVLILTETSRRDEAIKRLPFPAEIQEIHHFDSVSLVVVPIPAEFQIPSDLAADLRSAQVYIEKDGRRRDCQRRGTSVAAFHCTADRATGTVEAAYFEIEQDPRRCIPAFPPSDGATLVLEFPLDDTTEILRIRAGLDQRAARLESGDDVVYRLLLDDELIAEERVHGHTSRWTPHDINTRHLDDGPARLRVEVSSLAPRPHHRRFCFNAWGLTDLQASQSSKR